MVKDVFFGNESWLVYCVNDRTATVRVPAELKKVAELLRPESVRVAEVFCWIPLPTKKGLRTLAQRFKFRDQPPVALFVDQGQKPRLLDTSSQQQLSAKGLVKQVKRILRKKSENSTSAKSEGRRSKDKSSKDRSSKDRSSKGGRKESVGRRPVAEEEEEDAAETDTPDRPEEASDGGEEDEEVVNL